MATQVPAVRTAVHKATAPRAYAKPKTRVRVASAAPVKTAMAEAPCVSGAPVVIQNGQAFNLPELPQNGELVALGTAPDRHLSDRAGPDRDPAPAPTVIPLNPGDPGTPVSPVPEPSTWAQLLLGFVIVGGVMRSTSRGRKTEDDEALA